MRSDQAVAEKAEKPATLWSRLPSKPAADLISKAAAVGGTVAVATGTLNGTAEKIAAGVAALGWAAIEYKRQKNKREKGEGDG
jgi:hypothetical protein